MHILLIPKNVKITLCIHEYVWLAIVLETKMKYSSDLIETATLKWVSRVKGAFTVFHFRFCYSLHSYNRQCQLTLGGYTQWSQPHNSLSNPSRPKNMMSRSFMHVRLTRAPQISLILCTHPSSQQRRHFGWDHLRRRSLLLHLTQSFFCSFTLLWLLLLSHFTLSKICVFIRHFYYYITIFYQIV